MHHVWGFLCVSVPVLGIYGLVVKVFPVRTRTKDQDNRESYYGYLE